MDIVTSFTAHCRIISLKIRLRLILQFLEFEVLPVVNFVGLMPLAVRMFLTPARTPGGTQLLLSPSGLCPRPQGQAQPHASFSATLGHSGQALVLPLGGVLYTLTFSDPCAEGPWLGLYWLTWFSHWTRRALLRHDKQVVVLEGFPSESTPGSLASARRQPLVRPGQSVCVCGHCVAGVPGTGPARRMHPQLAID